MSFLDIMADIETLGKKPGCVLRSLGACAFAPREEGIQARFYYAIDRASCEAVGLVVDPETEAWWNDPKRDVAREALDAEKKHTLSDVLQAFGDFYALHAPVAEEQDCLWTNGPSFDEAILIAAYDACGLTPPWRYNAGRDCRTIYSAAGRKLQHQAGVFHHALDDAVEQALLVQESYRALGLARLPPKPVPTPPPMSGHRDVA